MTASSDALLEWLSLRRPGVNTQAPADALVADLPWVHRTSGAGKKQSWLKLFEEARIRAEASCTQVERDNGHPVAAYLFLGSAAYPKGLVAIVVDHRTVVDLGGTFTPFDSGGLLRGWMTAHGSDLELHNRTELWLQLHGDLREVDGFASRWIDAHFLEPLTYVLHPLVSEPDVEPAHGLQARDGLRLAWTIEAQVAQDVPLDEDTVVEVVCARRAIARQLPISWQGRASYLDDDVSEADFDQGVAKRIVNRAGRTS